MKRINSFHDEDAQGWWSKDDDENVDAKDVIEDDDAEDEFKDIETIFQHIFVFFVFLLGMCGDSPSGCEASHNRVREKQLSGAEKPQQHYNKLKEA